MKATYVEVDGEGREIFKDPVTDDGTKKSATGLLKVIKEEGEYKLIDRVSREDEESGCLETVFVDGTLLIEHSFESIRANATI